MKRRGFFGGVWATLVALFGVHTRSATPQPRLVVAMPPLFRAGDVVEFVEPNDPRIDRSKPTYVINISGVMGNERTQDEIRRALVGLNNRGCLPAFMRRPV